MSPISGAHNFFVFSEPETTSTILHGSKWYFSQEDAVKVMRITHNSYPVALLLLFLVSLMIDGIINSESAEPANATTYTKPKATGPGGKPLPETNTSGKAKKPETTPFTLMRRYLFAWLSVALIATFLGNAINVLVHALATKSGYWCGPSGVVYIIASAFLYSVFLLHIIDAHASPALPHFITWTVALLAELMLLILSVRIYTSPHYEINSLNEGGKFLTKASEYEKVEMSCDGLRVLLLVLCVAFYVFFRLQINNDQCVGTKENGIVNERTPLIHSSGPNGNGNGNLNGNGNGALVTNGTFTNGTTTSDVTPAEPAETSDTAVNGHAGPTSIGPSAPEERAAFYRPTSAPARSWWEYIRGYSLFFPYLWPSNSLWLKFIFVVAFFLVILARFINVLVPKQVGRITNILANGDEGGDTGMPWGQIAYFIFLKLLQGPPGLLGALRAVLWIPVAQYSYAALSEASFEHVHSLSLEFHLSKRTGEVLSALSKGAAINTFLEQITFQVIPMLIDLSAAIFVFQSEFGSYYSLCSAISTFWYLYVTIRLAQWRAEQRRRMVNADREEDAVKNDSISSYETVKYFGAEDYEFQRYHTTVKTFQSAESSVLLSLSIMNVTQNVIFMVGLLIVCFLAAWQVTSGDRSVGEFITLVTYMQQLQGPLNYFGTFYRSIQSAMISGERLLELFKEQPSVVDEDTALDHPSCDGEIKFENVKFSYDQRKPALKNLSFTCAPGTTTALVGESGGGKSTIFRLLFRFYNFQEGNIKLDGTDVRDITIKALRSHIGVVPQDTVLFNETLMYNLRYANQEATDEDIYDACRAASIHKKIMTFPDKYETKVGERGLRLSGGEKQRVAIARTILKNPRIILLDEATAALDSTTEQNIQEALKTLSEGRTMLVIAHRLSTITNADQILVLGEGAVIESGTHEELLDKKGAYASMWKQQIRAEQAAEHVRAITDHTSTRPNSREGVASDQ